MPLHKEISFEDEICADLFTILPDVAEAFAQMGLRANTQ